MTISVDDPRWDTRLMKPHRLELIASGITPDTAHAAGLYSESDPAKIAQLLHWSTPAMGLGACVVYPFLDRLGQPTGYHRLKPSKPRIAKSNGKDAKAIKYEGPKGQGNRLYIPPGTRAALADPSQTLFITEGEKKSLAADGHGLACVSVPGVWAWQKKRSRDVDGVARGPRELIDDLAVITWTGRVVFVIFDSDAVTNSKVLSAERALVKALESRGARVCSIRLPAAANAGTQGLDDFLVAQGAEALRTLMTVEAPGSSSTAQAPAKVSVPETLIRLALDEGELWHDPEGNAYATLGRQSIAVNSVAFEQWLLHRYYQQSGGRPASPEAISSARQNLRAHACFSGAEYPIHVRIAGHGERVYLHLADREDTVFEIDAHGWRECANPPVRFRRSRGMSSLPRPVTGGTLREFRDVLVLDDDDSFTSILAFVMGVFLPDGPYPTLVLSGEQGSGKSTLSRALKALIDPSAAPVRCEPKEVRDMMIAARNGHLLAWDNLSHLPAWLSDALCRLATGGGLSTRGLYTDDEEILFDAKRPVILNGIADFATRGDLLERGLLVRLSMIPETKRLAEKAYWTRFHTAHPRLLGLLLDRVSGGLRLRSQVKLDSLPRMADFAQWVMACERGAGDRPQFLEVYHRNRSHASEQALEDAMIVAPLLALWKEHPDWSGPSSALLEELNRRGPERKPPSWPKQANGLSGKLRRLMPDLRRIHGLEIEFDRREPGTRTKLIRLTVVPTPPTKQLERLPAEPTLAPTPVEPPPVDPVAPPGTRLRFRNNPYRGIPGLDPESP